MIYDLLPDTHEMLLREMPKWDFDNPIMPVDEFCASMVETMRHYSGIGLAANQIGIETCAFAMESDEGPIVLFNPIVAWVSLDTQTMREGCLSFPEVELRIARPRAIEVTYYEPSGAQVVKSFSDLSARCALHEIDHLEGRVFTSRVSKLKLAMAMKKASKVKKSQK